MRHLQAGRIAEALESVSRMLLFAPDAAFLWRDAGVLHMRLGNLAAAISAFENFAIRADGPAVEEATAILKKLKAKLN